MGDFLVHILVYCNSILTIKLHWSLFGLLSRLLLRHHRGIHSMPTRLRQVALVTNNLEATLDTLTSALDAPVVERDPGVAAFGLHNGIIQLGDCFLEIVSPLPGINPLETAGGRYLHKYGNSGYMVLMQVDNLHLVETKMSQLQLQSVHAGGRARDMSNRTHQVGQSVPRSGITGTHYHPRDMGCIIEVTESTPKHEWLWAGNEWHAKDLIGINSTRCGAYARIEIACSSPDQVCTKWELGMALLRDAKKRNTLRTEDGCEIFFREPMHSKENGPVAIELWSRAAALDEKRFVVCGVVFTFVPPRPRSDKVSEKL